MSIADYAEYKKRRDGWFQNLSLSKNSTTTIAGRSFSTWRAGGFPAAGAAPTTAAVPTNATTGAWGQNNSSGTQRILRTILGWSSSGGLFTVADRLSHQGGLSGTVTGAQTTNLPTSALTRQTTGVGVELGLEIYTQIGATGTTITCSYTNDANTAGQITPASVFGATNNREASRLIVMPLQAGSGDRGVRAVANVNIVATTGTAGAFGVTLFYPLYSILLTDIQTDVEAMFGMGTWFPIVESNACLMGIVHMSGTSTGVVNGKLFFGED